MNKIGRYIVVLGRAVGGAVNAAMDGNRIRNRTHLYLVFTTLQTYDVRIRWRSTAVMSSREGNIFIRRFHPSQFLFDIHFFALRFFSLLFFYTFFSCGSHIFSHSYSVWLWLSFHSFSLCDYFAL